MTELALVLAGGVGAAGRYWVGGLVQQRIAGRFPVGTIVVNLSGCLLAGFVLAAAPAGSIVRASLFGFAAGFTTFSTWSAESLAMLRTGERVRAAVNLAGMLVAGIGLCALGYLMAN
jgi:CrcB protein